MFGMVFWLVVHYIVGSSGSTKILSLMVNILILLMIRNILLFISTFFSLT